MTRNFRAQFLFSDLHSKASSPKGCSFRTDCNTLLTSLRFNLVSYIVQFIKLQRYYVHNKLRTSVYWIWNTHKQSIRFSEDENRDLTEFKLGAYVCPCITLFLAFTSTPPSINSRMISTWPACAATWRAVIPSCGQGETYNIQTNS